MDETDKWVELVKKYIDESGWTYREVARRCDLRVSTINNWINGGTKRTRWLFLVKFALGMGLNRLQMDELLEAASYPPLSELVAKEKEERDVLERARETYISKDVPWLVPFKRPSIVGRTKEHEQIEQILRDHKPPVIILQGMGGIGKSTLAIDTAYQCRTHFVDGVLWADVRNTSNNGILEIWAHKLGVDLSRIPDESGRAAHLIQILSEKNALLILDDVADKDLEQIQKWLPANPTANLAIIITTRSRNIAATLGVKEEDAMISLDKLEQADSLKLLANLLGDVDQVQEAASNVATLLGHHPLALTLIAKRCKASRLTLDVMHDALKSAADRMNYTGIGDQSVELAFDQSWVRLSPDKQQALRYFSLFQGRSFTAEAFAAVMNVEPFKARILLGDLFALALISEVEETADSLPNYVLNTPMQQLDQSESNLVTTSVQETVDDAPRRYQQHPLLADYALIKFEKNVGADEKRAAELRLAKYYKTFVQTHAGEHMTLIREWDNCRHGMMLAHQHEQWQYVLDYVASLEDMWLTQALYTDAAEMYALAKTAAIKLDQIPHLGHIFYLWGKCLTELCRYDDAMVRLDSALNIYMREEDDYRIARIYHMQARIIADRATDKEHYEDALDLLDQAKKICQETEDIAGIAESWMQIGRIASIRNEYEEAIIVHKQELDLQVTLNNTSGQLCALINLINACLNNNQLDLAETYAQEAMRISELVSDVDLKSDYYFSLSFLFLQLSDLDRAFCHAKQCLVLKKRIGDVQGEAATLQNLALIHLKKRSLSIAYNRAKLALRKVRQLGSIYAILGILITYAYILLEIALQLKKLTSGCDEKQYDVESEKFWDDQTEFLAWVAATIDLRDEVNKMFQEVTELATKVDHDWAFQQIKTMQEDYYGRLNWDL